MSGSSETIRVFAELLTLLILNFLLCRQVEMISDLLFNRKCLSAFMIQSFSSKHKLHLFDPPEYEAAFFKIDQIILKSCFFSCNVQICFESSVSFEYFLFLNDFAWFLYRSLKVFAVMPM